MKLEDTYFSFLYCFVSLSVIIYLVENIIIERIISMSEFIKMDRFKNSWAKASIELKLSNGEVLQVDTDGYFLCNETETSLFDHLGEGERDLKQELEKRLIEILKNDDYFTIDTYEGKILTSQVTSFYVY